MNQFIRKAILSILIVLLSQSLAHAQSIGDWRVYSSYSTINSISSSLTDDYYVVTQGGLFIVKEGIIQSRFTTIDGMHRLDGVKALYDDINNRLIIGYSDGVIDLFDIDTQEFIKIDDIARVSEFTSKGINYINIRENQIHVATDFGIVVFDRDQFFVTNSYLNLGNFVRGTRVNDISFFNDSIYVATSEGIASGLISANLVDATNWNSIVLTEAVNSEIIAIEVANSNIYAIASDTLFNWNSGIWSVLNDQPITNPIILETFEDDLIVGNSDRAISLDSSGQVELVYDPESSNITSIHSSNLLLIGTRENGLIELSQEERIFNPVGPYLNFFSELEFQDGVLLASATSQFPQSDPFNSIRGYYTYSDNNWENYNRNTNTVLSDFRFSTAYTVDITSENFIVGSWGDGVAIQSRETNEINVYDNGNTGLSGISANREFIVISGLDTDSQENTWAISFISNLPLNVYSSSKKEWSHFPSLPINNDELYFRIFVDSRDKLWIPLIDIGNNGKGIIVIDPGQDPFDDSDDTFRKLTTGENSGNLPDDNVVSVIEDKNGEVWIGTTRGLARFIFPDFIVSSNNPSEFSAQWLINSDTSATSRFLLRDVNVSTIAVNSANQKWIGSANQGLWLLNEDGSEIIERYTSENSPLISDNILDIAINDNTGEVYISTDLGLVSIIETANTPVNKMDELKVYPNPFVYSKNDQIVIEGLSDHTEIKIIGSDGSVFSNFETRGGRVNWNGMDANGNKLASGVYFIVALDDEGIEKGIGKVVIIR